MVLFKCFLEILQLDWHFFFRFLTPAFSFIMLFHIIIILFTLWTRDTLRKVNCLKLSQALVLLLCHFVMNLNKMNCYANELLWIVMQIICPDWSATYWWQVLTGKHFHRKRTTNPKVNMILLAAIIPLCAIPSQLQSAFNCTIIFGSPSLMFFVQIHPGQTRRSASIKSFWNFTMSSAHSTHKKFNSAFSVSFIGTIIFQSLFLESPCTNPPTPCTQHNSFAKL